MDDMNTRFLYLYRDAGNNKARGSVVFAGSPRSGDLARLLRAFEASTYFVAEQIDLPVLYLFESGYGFDSGLDHCYHEFENLGLTVGPPSDARTVQEFIAQIERESRNGWRVPESFPKRV